MTQKIYYGDEPLNKSAFSQSGGVWFNDNGKQEHIPHPETIDFVTMNFVNWLKYFSTIKPKIL